MNVYKSTLIDQITLIQLENIYEEYGYNMIFHRCGSKNFIKFGFDKKKR